MRITWYYTLTIMLHLYILKATRMLSCTIKSTILRQLKFEVKVAAVHTVRHGDRY